jgi:hypothetical protein
MQKCLLGAGDVAQVVERLLGKCDSSSDITNSSVLIPEGTALLRTSLGFPHSVLTKDSVM